MDHEERMAAIVRLLDTRYEGLPEPRRRELPTSPGFVHKDAMVACPDCLTNDRDRKRDVGCETCRGTGRVLERRTKDPMDDPIRKPDQDGRRKTYFGGDAGEARVARNRALDAYEQRIARELERLTHRPSVDDLIAEANASGGEPWEIARKRMYREFDYKTLDIAVEQLRLAHPAVSPYSPRGLAFIDPRMPDPIRAPEEAQPAKLAVGQVKRAAGAVAIAKRNEEIRRAVLEAGEPTASVARTWGITLRQVNNIIALKEAA